MFRQLRRWLGIGVLGTLCVAGCSHASSSHDSTGPSLACASGSIVSQHQPVVRAPCPACQAAAEQTIADVRPAVASPSAPARQVEAAMNASVQQAAAWQSMVDPPSESASAAPAKVAQTAAVTAPAVYQEEKPAAVGRGETVAARRSYSDITGSANFGHAGDYSWLSGQVEKTHRGWRLRYAWVDEDDPYGGSVSLNDDPTLPAFKDGQMIRVSGHLVDPQNHGPAPAYRVEGVEAIN
jgi:hypothetical protein